MGPIASFADLIKALWRQRLPIALVLGLGLPAAYLYAASRSHVYEAVAVVQIEAPEVAQAAVGSGGVADALSAGPSATSELDLIEQGLMARSTIQGLADRFGLFAEAGSETERVALVRGAITITEIVDPAQAWRADVRPSGLSIAVRLGDPEEAARLANALVDTIVAEAAARAQARASTTLDFLQSEEARVGEAIAAVEGRIADFRAANLASLPEGLTAQRERVARLSESRIALDRDIIAFEGGADRLRPEEAARQRAAYEDQRRVLDAAVAEAEAAIAAAPAVERELGALGRQLQSLEAELTVVTERRTEAAMARTLEERDQAGRFTVLERAVPPEFPVSASRTKIALAGGATAGAVALALALAREVMQRSLRSAAQMRAQLGLDPLVVVPNLRARRRFWGDLAGLLAVLAALGAAGWAVARFALDAAWRVAAGRGPRTSP